MEIVRANREILFIGWQGENLARQVQFPIADWLEEYGAGGVFQLLVRRPGEGEYYPAVIADDDEIVYWDVTSTDTALAGHGDCELQYYLDDIIAKSQKWKTQVQKSAANSGDMPSPYESWMQQVLSLASGVEQDAKDAESAAKRAETAAESAAEDAGRASAAAAEAADLKMIVQNAFTQLRDAIANKDPDSAVAILDQAILDISALG